jgi:hypothetical protein
MRSMTLSHHEALVPILAGPLSYAGSPLFPYPRPSTVPRSTLSLTPLSFAKYIKFN